jgi:hypothetical protein
VVRWLYDPRCNHTSKSGQPCARKERPYLIIEDGRVLIKKAYTHGLLQACLCVHACMTYAHAKRKQGDHVIYKATQADSTEGDGVRALYVLPYLCRHVHIHHEKRARGALRSASQRKALPRGVLPSVITWNPPHVRPRQPRRLLRQQLARPQRLGHADYFDSRSLGHDHSATPTTSTS